MKSLIRAILVIIAYISMVAVNTLANILPFNGVTTGEISDRFDVSFVPADYVFTIWWVIYVLLGVYAVFQILKPQLQDKNFDKIGILFIVNSIANAAWTFLWHHGYINSTVLVMAVILLSLISIYLIIHRENLTHWAVRLPFSVYLGWISVATISNITVMLYSIGWDGFGISGPVWSALLIAVATILGIIALLRYKDFAYSAVIIWALIGMYVNFSDSPVISLTAAISVGLLTMFIVYRLIQSSKSQTKPVGNL